MIYTKGLLDTDVRDLYHKVRSSYEKILLGDYEQQELQDVEYSLCKLHNKHIDEFWKRTKIQQNTNHIEGFRWFCLKQLSSTKIWLLKSENVTIFHEGLCVGEIWIGEEEKNGFEV